MIIPIFGPRVVSSVLAHDSTHSVPGITLPPGDAHFSLFHCLHRLVWCSEEGSLVGFLVFEVLWTLVKKDRWGRVSGGTSLSRAANFFGEGRSRRMYGQPCEALRVYGFYQVVTHIRSSAKCFEAGSCSSTAGTLGAHTMCCGVCQ